MRRLIFIFGLLDLSIVAIYPVKIPHYLRGITAQPWLNGICLLMMVSLVVSGYALLRDRRWAFIVNYVQFPFRIVLAFLSFAWLAELILPLSPSMLFHELVWISAIALEGIRLGLTIMMHYHRRRRPDQPPLSSGSALASWGSFEVGGDRR